MFRVYWSIIREYINLGTALFDILASGVSNNYWKFYVVQYIWRTELRTVSWSSLLLCWK
jgi:hypothetical protein